MDATDRPTFARLVLEELDALRADPERWDAYLAEAKQLQAPDDIE